MTARPTGRAAFYLSNGTINNNGAWTANSSSTLNSQGYLSNTVNVFNNNVTGTFTQEGTGTTFNSWYTGVVFNNLGVVDADSGTFASTTGVPRSPAARSPAALGTFWPAPR